jgi:hypothetical protein
MEKQPFRWRGVMARAIACAPKMRRVRRVERYIVEV